jgi:DDE superfamily endonuclease
VSERASTTGEALGLPTWCMDEAGPSQAIPYAGPSWAVVGQPAHIPHESVRGGTAKRLTLCRPATGEVRALPVPSAPNAVLPPWLKQELAAILRERPPVEAGPGRHPADWEWRDAPLWDTLRLPPVRLLLIWDNLKGHHTPDLVAWLLEHGVWPISTPLGGSWLNRAESVQRILVRRALDGQHPERAEQVIAWLAAAVQGGNADPTPFAWGGQRAARRQRARARRHALGGSGGDTRTPLPRHRPGRAARPLPIGYAHGN